MKFRRIELLIKEIREATDIKAERVSDIEMLGYYNYALSQIQSLVFSINPESAHFNKVGYVSSVMNQASYDLPADVFGDNALKMVSAWRNNGGSVDTSDPDGFIKLNPIQEIEKGVIAGYYVSDNQLWISPRPTVSVTDKYRLSYFRRLPSLATRVGVVSSSTSGVSITITGGPSTDTITPYADYMTVVDSTGTVKAQGLTITGFNAGTGVISTNSSFTTVSNGDYVVLGYYSTTHCQLPVECEPLLQNIVKDFLFARQSSDAEMTMQMALTKSQKEALSAIFSDLKKDPLYPPITDADYMRL